MVTPARSGTTSRSATTSAGGGGPAGACNGSYTLLPVDNIVTRVIKADWFAVHEEVDTGSGKEFPDLVIPGLLTQGHVLDPGSGLDHGRLVRLQTLHLVVGMLGLVVEDNPRQGVLQVHLHGCRVVRLNNNNNK